MPTDTERLLDAEQAVTDLLATLEQFKKEVDGYAHANVALSEARAQIGELAERLGRLADRSRTVLDALAKIGTPEILGRVEDLRALSQQLFDGVSRATAGMQESQRNTSIQVQKAVTELSETVGSQTQSAVKAMTSLREGFASIQAKMSQDIEAANKRNAAELSQVHISIERRLKKLCVLVAVGLPIAVIVVVAAILASRVLFQ